MGKGNTVSNQIWHRSVHYPALSAEAVTRLQGKLSTLSATCDELARQNYEQENRIRDLEAHIAHLNSLKASYEDLIVAKNGYVIPAVPDTPEHFST